MRLLVRAEYPHATVDPAESGQLSFLTRLGQNLHADANPEYGHVLTKHHVIERIAHTGPVQLLHGVVECANAWEDDPRGSIELLGGSRPGGRNIQPLVHIEKGLDVPKPVVDDGDHMTPS